MSLTILAVGKKHESWVSEGINRYEERLRKPWDLDWQLLPHSSLEDDRARLEESERILSRLKDRDYVILLDETGRNLSSPELSSLLTDQINKSANIVLVIGGAYGVDRQVVERADTIWSLSKLVFPHQLVRLIIAEQLYRAAEISRGSKYHHI